MYFLKKIFKKIHKADPDENADYSETIRNLTNSIQIEKQMDTSFRENGGLIMHQIVLWLIK